ncbi:TPA: tryptophanase leader peptide, partial [Shigella flexneri]|nr:tryptophanase leader peptide [Shigella flexneri]
MDKILEYYTVASCLSRNKCIMNILHICVTSKW